ncbi:MAG: hypothetical protein AB1641_25950 [Thermodesulfobacteriota bacterium]
MPEQSPLVRGLTLFAVFTLITGAMVGLAWAGLAAFITWAFSLIILKPAALTVYFAWMGLGVIYFLAVRRRR